MVPAVLVKDWPVFSRAYWRGKNVSSRRGRDQFVRLRVLNGRVPAQGIDELQLLAGRHFDEVGAGAADAGAFAEAVLAQNAGCRALVAEFHNDLARHVR